jgi:membrane protein insertase Oxa1/YidC/SpoIIIJ
MDVFNYLIETIIISPIYNGLVAVYATLGQQNSGLTFILIGLAGALVCLPAIIRNYFDRQQVKVLHERIADIQERAETDDEKQQKVLAFLKSQGVTFQSESVYLFFQGLIAVAVYPVLLNHWNALQPHLLYAFTPLPDAISPTFLNISVTQPSPTLSLLPAILLFFELRQSYAEQRFLTGFVDRWYPVILPLLTYFLIFWLPSGIPLLLAASLAVSLYLKMMLDIFTRLRQTRPAKL